MPLAAVLLLRDAAKGESDTRWTAVHLAAMFGCLLAGFLLMTLVFTEGVVPEAARMQIEPHPFIKLLWFLRNPLPNSIALFALRDSYATPFWFWLVVAAVAAVAVLGFVYGAPDARRRWRWLFAALLLPFVAHSVSLAASSQAIGYRTLLPLSGLFLVLFVFGFRAMAARWRLPRYAAGGGSRRAGRRRRLARTAQRSHADGRAAGQRMAAHANGRESFALSGARRASTSFGRRSSIARRTRVYADEYGSLSADAQWAAVEMFRAAVRQRFPQGLPDGTTLYADDKLHPADRALRPRARFARAQEPRRARAEGDYRFRTLTTSGSMKLFKPSAEYWRPSPIPSRRRTARTPTSCGAD